MWRHTKHRTSRLRKKATNSQREGGLMPRARHRACLKSGLKLDLNKLIRQECIVPGAWQ